MLRTGEMNSQKAPAGSEWHRGPRIPVGAEELWEAGEEASEPNRGWGRGDHLDL